MWKDLNDKEKEEYIQSHFPFEKIRPIQKDVIKLILDKFLLENQRYVILELPTGSGKSVIAYTVAKIMDNEIETTNTFLTASKQLQEQYLRDFKDLKNISNSIDYPCALTSVSGEPRPYHYGDEDCMTSSNIICKKKCPYLKESQIWRNARYRVTNYHFYGNLGKVCGEANCETTFLNIYDEAHNLPSITIDLSEIRIRIPVLKNAKNVIEKNILELQLHNYPKQFNFNKLNDFIKIIHKIYKGKNEDGLYVLDDEDDKKILSSISGYLSEFLEDIKKFIEYLKEKEIGFNPDVFKMIRLLEVMEKYASILSSGGIFFVEKNEEENEILIKPFYAFTANRLFFKKGDYHLFLSATIGDIEVFTEELGIKDYFFKSYEGIFPKENRPIYYLPICNFSYKYRDEAIENIASFLNELLPQYKGKRGVIHTSSYQNCKDIYDKLDFENAIRITIPENTRELKKYLKTGNYDILMSPILFEGADLKDDLAEFQVLTKIPFPSLGDNYTKTKLKYFPQWYSHLTTLKVIQSYGRGVRHENDKCDFFIVDSNFNRIKKYLPKWIKEAIEE